jgi:steroid 5-alpha reductase family enzyme
MRINVETIPVEPILLVWAAASIAMLIGWVIQLRTRNAGIVDAIWALCMSGAAMLYASVGQGGLVPRFTVAVLGGFWGFRLCMHLLARVLTEHEDGRYRYLRQHWRDNQLYFFLLFQAQALLAAVFSLPFYAVAWNPAMDATPWILGGVAVWAVSITGETWADMQLSQFRRDPRNRGRTCRSGLWMVSRHPNYFFEWMHWFAYVLLAVGSPHAWLAWLGPLLMGASLCWISGIPFTEAQALRRRGDDYRDYQRTTSMLIPWFPKKHRRGALPSA